MDPVALARMKQDIEDIFEEYDSAFSGCGTWLGSLVSGKLYELRCLADVLQRLRRGYGYDIRFSGRTINFQFKGGKIDPTRSHFEVSNRSKRISYKLYTDIYFETLGYSLAKAEKSTRSRPDRSRYHELDIALVPSHVIGCPPHDQIILGVECKSTALFQKSIVKAVLGVRRELSKLSSPRASTLRDTSPRSGKIADVVRASPPSEYWLYFLDERGMLYAQSPREFGIKFIHLAP